MTTAQSQRRRRLLRLYEIAPFHEHPLWVSVKRGELTLEQVLLAERQHYVRTSRSRHLRLAALEQARTRSRAVFEALLETYVEECTSVKQGPSHLELIERLLIMGGVTETELVSTRPTPGNSAAIALYKDISERGAACHLIGAGAVEYHYSELCPSIYRAYTENYGMSDAQAETYRVHGPMDKVHGERAFAVLDDALKVHAWSEIEMSVRDAFIATSLHYDGMLQGATGSLAYWDGKP